MEMKKILALGVILLFIGVAVAPSINSSVVKTSDDLVEVTSQACGIQGFGNTAVKLTKQQYQNLEQYLVDFRARLNQTTTREEAVPIFKEAVVELNKYGLLPKRMSIEQAQSLVTSQYQNKNMEKIQQKLLHNHLLSLSNNSNFLCLIAGKATNCHVAGPIIAGISIVCMILYSLTFFDIFLILVVLSSIVMEYKDVVFGLINIFSLLTFGMTNSYGGVTPAVGSIFTAGLLGIKNYTGSFSGKILYPVVEYGEIFYTGAFGFTGIKINFPDHSSQFFGTALRVKISDSLS